MTRILEADEKGSLHLPADLLHAGPKARFEVESSSEGIVLRRVEEERPFSEAATPQERVARFREWVSKLPKYETDVHLTDEQLRRENIYD
ncbi:MAG TPA: hypothetical protein VLJ39_21075 [Tepidisphaeraceae bacterium]|jgi:hypothetical protein|nr:hypothetical protein [Tepidisphaeraceae bacterium]